MFETLEDRIVPAQYLWTNGTANGLALTAANWTDLASGPSAVPGSGDYMIFGSGGSSTPILINGNMSVDRVVMDSGYASTFTIGSGYTLTTTNQFVQYGSLYLDGTGELDVGTSFYGNGDIHNTPGFGTTGVIDVQGDFYLNSGASITATSSFSDALAISSAGFDDGGTIYVGSMTTVGNLTIAGPYVQASGAVMHVYSGSTMSFTTNGITGAHATMEGTVNLGAGTYSTGGASISTASQLYLDGGTLVSIGSSSANSMSGDIGVYNSGVIDIGNTTLPSTLAHLTGSLTVGAPNSSGTSTGGTVNINTGSVLNFPAAASTSTFVVMSAGEVNMYGATITMNTSRVAAMDIRGALNSYGAFGGSSGFPQVGDSITGNVLNDGLLEFFGNLHGLSVTGNYTQDSAGTLSMRLKNGAACDGLGVSGNTTLAGVLSLAALETLALTQTWALIGTGGSYSGDFDTFVWPDTSTWLPSPGVPYLVNN